MKTDYLPMFLSRLFDSEGGYSANLKDPGNWTSGKVSEGVLKGTKYGISAAAYPDLDIKNLTIEQAADIYRDDYWLKPGFDKLPPAIGFQVFDTGVNSGVSRATKLLQKVVGAKEDGVLGPSTLALVAQKDQDATITAFNGARKAFLHSLPSFATFGKGWIARVDSNQSFAASDIKTLTA